MQASLGGERHVKGGEVSAVCERVNEGQNQNIKVPSSAEEGWMRDQKRNCEATKIRADGVVLVQFHHIF